MERDHQREEQCNPPGDQERKLAGYRPRLQSNWITRLLMPNTSSSDHRGGAAELLSSGDGIRRSLSCPSLPDAPRSFLRRVAGMCDDDQDAEEGDMQLERFLGNTRPHKSGLSSSWWLGQGESESGSSSRPLCLSLDRGAFVCKDRTRSVPHVPRTIIRGFGGGGELKIDLEGPLPYSSFEDQKSGKSATVQRPKKNVESEEDRWQWHSAALPHHCHSAALLHPILADYVALEASGNPASGDNDAQESGLVHRRPSGEQFVHPESVLKTFYNKQQLLLPRGAIGSEWLTRWSGSSNEENSRSSSENLLRLRSAFVPSARALAIVGKSSRSVNSSDSTPKS